MTYGEVITTRILALCKAHNITLNKLATQSGMSQSTLNNIIQGNTKSPGLRSLHRVAQGFGMTLSEFLNFPEMDETPFEDD